MVRWRYACVWTSNRRRNLFINNWEKNFWRLCDFSIFIMEMQTNCMSLQLQRWSLDNRYRTRLIPSQAICQESVKYLACTPLPLENSLTDLCQINIRIVDHYKPSMCWVSSSQAYGFNTISYTQAWNEKIRKAGQKQNVRRALLARDHNKNKP